MKRRSDKSFRIWSVIMVLSGLFEIALDIQLMLLRFQTFPVSRFLILIASLILLAAGILEIVAGMRGLIFTNNVSRGRRYRAISAKIQNFKRLALAALILSVIEVIISLAIGIFLWQLAAIAVGGILLPLIYIISAKSLKA